MISAPSKKKQKSKKQVGRSEFLPSKMQKNNQYQPKVRRLKQMFFHSGYKKQRFKTDVTDQQKQGVIDHAIAQLKLGKSIALDWGTKSNFRSTYTKSHILSSPTNSLIQTKKQEQQLLKRKRQFQLIIRKKRQSHKQNLEYIKIKKSNDLRKKLDLEHRNKKTITVKPNLQLQKFVYQMQKDFLSPKKSIRNSRISRKSVENILDSLQGDSRTKIFKIQEQILKRSKLSILKRQLQQKFFEIREAYKSQNQRLQ